MDYVDALKRVVAPPGRFAELYPAATDDELAFSILDALGEVQLDGLLMRYNSDVNAMTIVPDITQAQGAMLVLYAAVRFVRAELLNRPQETRYEAPGVVYDVTYGAVLRDVLADLTAKKKEVFQRLSLDAVEGAFYMADMYVMKAGHHLGGHSVGAIGG